MKIEFYDGNTFMLIPNTEEETNYNQFRARFKETKEEKDIVWSVDTSCKNISIDQTGLLKVVGKVPHKTKVIVFAKDKNDARDFSHSYVTLIDEQENNQRRNNNYFQRLEDLEEAITSILGGGPDA